MTRRELLRRIERLETLTARLEQGMQDIWSSCSCLKKDLEEIPPNLEDLCGGEDFNCEPGCGECGEFLCICQPEEDDTIYCPEIEEEDHD